MTASGKVTVDTFKPGSGQSAEPLSLELSGHRNFFVVENGERRGNGTRIEVLLRPDLSLESGKLLEMVQEWCRKVEFPIEVADFGRTEIINAEQSEDFIFEVPDIRNEGAKFVLRHFPFDTDGLEGDLYLLAHRNADGAEDWTKRRWYENEYLKDYPQISLKELPNNLTCFHGITSDSEYNFRTHSINRFDIRNDSEKPILSRQQVKIQNRITAKSQTRKNLELRWQEILDDHISTNPTTKGEGRWKYIQKLIDEFEVAEDYWGSVPDSVAAHKNGTLKQMSWQYLNQETILTEIFYKENQYCLCGSYVLNKNLKSKDKYPVNLEGISLSITEAELAFYSDLLRKEIFRSRKPDNPRWIDRHYFAVDWNFNSDVARISVGITTEFYGCDFGRSDIIFAKFNEYYPKRDFCLVNSGSQLGNWLIVISKYSSKIKTMEYIMRTKKLFELFVTVASLFDKKRLSILQKHIKAWTAITDLPDNLKPPAIELTQEMFYWPPPGKDTSLR